MIPELVGHMIIPAAVILDLIAGDPARWPHPVRWMGRAIIYLEPPSRKLPIAPALSGGLMTAALVLGTWIVSYSVLSLAYKIDDLFGSAVAVIMLYYCLSMRSLHDAGITLWRALKKKSLPEAKHELQYIVGREVAPLDEQGVIRATIETVAENLVDGVISPLFYALIGGPALAMTYKMVNTLDSMIAYKNEKYRHFGYAAAKLDDAANWLPARLCIAPISLASQLISKKGTRAFSMAMRDGRNHSSPNAGFPEAAFAGCLELQLGGPNVYHGQIVNKPYIGTPSQRPKANHIRRACDLMLLSAVLWTAIIWLPVLASFISRRWLW